jgi:hypothetical protein
VLRQKRRSARRWRASRKRWRLQRLQQLHEGVVVGSAGGWKSAGRLMETRMPPKSSKRWGGPRHLSGRIRAVAYSTVRAASTLQVESIRRECAGRPYVDPKFGGPPGIGENKWEVAPKWARMSEMSTAPAIVESGGFSPDSLVQGSLGDCWFISALSALASRNEAFLKNLILTPEIDPTGAGVYAVRLWKNGGWVEIILDDRFPVRKAAYWDAEDQKIYGGGGPDLRQNRLGAPVFLGSRSHNEFWGMMLEKALAKYYGGYSRIEGGWARGLLNGTCAAAVPVFSDYGRSVPTFSHRPCVYAHFLCLGQVALCTSPFAT